MKPTIFRYRVNFANEGKGSWQYTDEYNSQEQVEEGCDREYSWSEYYRGCDVEEVTFPFIKWAQTRVAEIETDIKRQQAFLEYYRAYLSGIGAGIFND